MLAEAVSLDGGTLLLVLVVALLLLVVSVAVVVLGFVLAPRAARGSRRALTWWVVVLAVEGLYTVASQVAGVSAGFSLWTLALPVVIAAQVAVFLRAREAGD